MKIKVIKNIIIYILILIVIYPIINFTMNKIDVMWENRAKAAGYYNQLPDSFKNIKDLNK